MSRFIYRSCTACMLITHRFPTDSSSPFLNIPFRKSPTRLILSTKVHRGISHIAGIMINDQNTMDTPEEAEKHYRPQRITQGRRDVITAFVWKKSNNTVLLVQRSNKVNTYQFHWGGVSGVVEGDENCRHRAEQEIVEEVGYETTQLKFVRSGRPLFVDDNAKGLRFAVHPYLFELTTESEAVQPRLNWENVDARFFSVNDTDNLETVPQLQDTLRRVLIPSHTKLKFICSQGDALEKIINDRSHGAAQLALWVLDALQQEAEQNRKNVPRRLDNGDGTRALDDLRNFGYHLAACRPSMTPLADAAASVLSIMHRNLHDCAGPFACSTEQVFSAALHAIAEVRHSLNETSGRLQRHAQELLQDGMTIMTISKSSSVLSLVENALASGKRLKTIVCESRPLCEGVNVAQRWADAGAHNTQLITDAQAAYFMSKVDLVIVGADSVDEDGIYNKVGTRLLALAAKDRNVPFCVVTDTSKISPGRVERIAHPGINLMTEGEEEEGEEEKSIEEVILGWPSQVGVIESPRVKVRNVYFEVTPWHLVSRLITENGEIEIKGGGISGEIARKREMYDEGFVLS